MPRRLTSLATSVAASVTAALALVAGFPVAASAGTTSCLPGGTTRCRVWTGTVVRVTDGDTLYVDVAGDGTATPRSIRLIDAQAMELSVHSAVRAKRRGDCHALAATARLEQLIRAGGGIVRLTAQDPEAQSLGRPLRAVQVRIGGVWRDAGLDLVRRGLALWQPWAGEWAWNATYRTASQQAAAEGLNLFDTDACGPGPDQPAQLSVDVDWQQELLHVTNGSPTAVAVGGWWVRDSGLRRFTFPARTVIPPGGTITVHVLGTGRTTATDMFWGLSAPIFDNPTGDEQAHGDGGYLFDPQGDLRAWMIYPSS